jgi:hypothetical protein
MIIHGDAVSSFHTVSTIGAQLLGESEAYTFTTAPRPSLECSPRGKGAGPEADHSLPSVVEWLFMVQSLNKVRE